MEENVMNPNAEELIVEFKQKLESLCCELDENHPQKKLLRKVSAVADQISPLQLVNMMKEIEEYGDLMTIPKEALMTEGEPQALPPEQQAQPTEQQEATSTSAESGDKPQEPSKPTGDDNANAPVEPLIVDLDMTDEDTEYSFVSTSDEGEYLWDMSAYSEET